MRAQLRLWGQLLPDASLGQIRSQLIDTDEWTIEQEEQVGDRARSQLLDMDPKDIETVISLRLNLQDILVARQRHSAKVRMTARDGIALHFDLLQEIDIPDPFEIEHLEAVLMQRRSSYGKLGLNFVAAALTVDLPNLTAWANVSSEIKTLGDLDGDPCLLLIDSSVPTLVVTENPSCPIEGNAIDDWYMHVVTCMAARDLLTSARVSVAGVTNALSEITLQPTPDASRVALGSAIVATQNVSAIRRELSLKEAQREAIRDYRKINLADINDRNHHEQLYRTLERRHAVYYSDPVDVAIGAMAAGVTEMEGRTLELLEIANLSYNASIQEQLKRLQIAATVLAILSLAAAVIAIVVTQQ